MNNHWKYLNRFPVNRNISPIASKVSAKNCSSNLCHPFSALAISNPNNANNSCNFRFELLRMPCFTSYRFYHKQVIEIKKRISWKKPKRVHCSHPEKSGDLSGVPEVDRNLPPSQFIDSPDYQKAPDLVKRVLSLNFQPRLVVRDALITANVDKVRQHKFDCGLSMESSIARLTVIIRRIQKHIEANPKDSRSRSDAKEIVDRRKKRLKALRLKDYKRFEWCLEQLDLQFKPHPPLFVKIERKASLRKLADEYANNAIKQSLAAYKNTLETRQPDFLSRKLAAMKSIIADEVSVGLEPSFTEEEIQTLQEKVDALVKEENEKQLLEKAYKKSDY